MPVYKFKFGEITVADGLPAITPALTAWVEAEADRLIGLAMQAVVNGLVQRLHAYDCLASPVAAPPSAPLSIAAPVPLEHLSTVQIHGLTTTQLDVPAPRPGINFMARRLADGTLVKFTGQDQGIVDGFYHSLFVIDGREMLHQQPVTALAAAADLNAMRMALDLEFLQMVCGLDGNTVEVVL